MAAVLVESSVRIALFAPAVWLVLRLMRIKTPAMQHYAWSAVTLLMLLLPLIVSWTPKAALPILPTEAWQGAALSRTAAEAGTASLVNDNSVVDKRSPTPVRSIDWRIGVAGLYVAGVFALLIHLVAGMIQVRCLIRNATLDEGRLVHASCSTPLTVGFFRPIVILPEDWSRWPQGQLDAVLVHEEAHIRRRDPIFQVLALLNRAVFWFHPLSWWLERRLSRLAEEACDSAVLERGLSPQAYSEYLLNLARSLERSGARIQSLGMGMPGGYLLRRLRKIFNGVQAPKPSRTRLALAAASCCIAALAFGITTLVHAQLASPSFEAASIKPNRSGEQGGSSHYEAGRYEGRNVTLMRVIRLAYAPIQDFESGPGWINSDHYDISAKAEGNPAREQLQLMMRSLLADRFKLVIRKETREKSAYELILARRDGKLGPKLRPADGNCTADKDPCGGFRVDAGVLSGRRITIERLAAELTFSGRLVLDRTGLSGPFDVDLEWTPDELGAGAPADTRPSLFSALQEQLGLKLESAKAAVEVLIIDSAERPSEN